MERLRVFVVTGGRGAGKTQAICRWLTEDPGSRCVVVPSRNQAQYLLHMLQDAYSRGNLRNYDWRPHIVAAVDLQIGGFGRGVRAFHYPEVAIDDGERVFSVWFGVNLEFMTVNATWIPLSPNDGTIKAEVLDGKEIESGIAYPVPMVD